MHAPAKPAYPVLDPAKLAEFDAFLFGIPTRYGNFPAQWKVRTRPQRPLSRPVLIAFHHRRSGTRLAPSGLKVRSQASTLASSCPPAHPAEAKVRLPLTPPRTPVLIEVPSDIQR